MEVIYKGWIIKYGNFGYEIHCITSKGKRFKVYSRPGTNTKDRDKYGSKLYKRFSCTDEALTKGKTYVDNFEDRLQQYLLNRENKVKL